LKVAFPCNGSIILKKQDIEALENFYSTKSLPAKMAGASSIIVKNAKFLSVKKFRSILNTPGGTEAEEELISDGTILSHPFFKTLRPLN